MLALKNLHRWVGLALALPVLVIALTGTLLIWSPEYIRATVPQAQTEIQNDLISLSKAVDVILQSHPADSVRFIEFNPNNLSLHKAYLSNKSYAWHSQDGSLVQTWSANERLEDWLLDLHHRFLLGNTVGLNLAGFSGLLLILLTLVGIFLWWPARGSAAFIVRPKPWRYGLILRSHKNHGILSTFPILMLAITGVVLVYPSEAGNLLLGEPSRQAQRQQALTQYDAQLTTLEKLATSLEVFPNASIKWVRPPNDGFDKFIVGVQQTHSWNRLGKSHVLFDQDVPTEKLDALAQTPDKRLFDFLFPLHTAQLPVWYRLALTVFGIMLLIVIVMGCSAWFKRSLKGGKQK